MWSNWKNNLTPAKIAAEPRYVSTIARNNADDVELDPFGTGNSQLAALLLEIEQVLFQNNPNSPTYMRVPCLAQITRKTVRNIRHNMRCANVLPADGQLSDSAWVSNKVCPYQSGLYLRGGLSYRVIIECRPALAVIRVQDTPETLFFVDPPYMPSTRTKSGYRHEMTEADHVALLEQLRQVKGMVVLAGYPSTLYDTLLSDWHRIERPHRAQGSSRVRTEVLWLSPAAVAKRAQQGDEETAEKT